MALVALSLLDLLRQLPISIYKYLISEKGEEVVYQVVKGLDTA